MTIQNGDVLVGARAPRILHLRDGVTIGELSPGTDYDFETNQWVSGIARFGSCIYAARTINGYPGGDEITNRIERYDLEGGYLGAVFEEVIENVNVTGANDIIGKNFRRGLAIDRHGNFWVPQRHFTRDAAPPTTVYLLEKYSPDGKLLARYIPVTVEGDSHPTRNGAYIAGLAYAQGVERIYYTQGIGNEHGQGGNTPTETTGVHVFDIASETVLADFADVLADTGSYPQAVARLCDGEVWVSLFDGAATPLRAARYAGDGTLIETYSGLFAEPDPYTISLALDYHGDHFWLGDGNEQTVSRVLIADGSYALFDTVFNPIGGEIDSLYGVRPSVCRGRRQVHTMLVRS